MRLRLFVVLTTVLLVVVGATLVIYNRLEEFNGASDQVVGPAKGDNATGATTSTTSDLSSDPSTLVVHGEVTEVHLVGAVPQPRTVPTPLTVDADRGFGNGAEVTGVTVDGKATSIVWDGGRPFVLSSGKGLVLDPLTVDLDKTVLRCALGGGAHRFEPGTYRLDTPVAIGAAGVATERDSVTFTAGPTSQLEAHGNAALVLDTSGDHRFLGPGLVHLQGTLVVEGEQGPQPVTMLDLTNGDFDLTISPAEGGRWTVSGRIRNHGIGNLVLR